MKILQIVPYFYPAWSYGGPAKLAYDTSIFFSEQGHQVTLYTSDAYDKESRMPKSLHINKKNLKVHYFKNFNNFLTYNYNIFFTPGLFLRAIFEVKKFDIIHIHDFYTLQNFWVGILARIYGIPYIVSVHGCLEDKRMMQRSLFKKIFYNLYGLKLLKYASRVIATSKNEVEAYKLHGIQKDKIILLGHGIDMLEFETKKTKSQCKEHFNLEKNQLVVTFLGRIHKIKGLNLLVEAISQIRNKLVTFVIAGSDDGYLSELEFLIKKFKISNRIKLLPACFGKEKSMLFKASDIFVYPSYSEGFSLGILEAAASGLPLLITTGCHFPLVAKARAGIIVEPSYDVLKNGLNKLLDSANLRKEYGENAKRLVKEKYSMSYIGNTLLGIYEKLI